MDNPFTSLQEQLISLESKLENLQISLSANSPEIESRLTTNEAAEYLNISKGTLYNLHSLGTIRGHKRGNRLYFFKSELNELIRNGP